MKSLPICAGGVGWGVFGSYAKYTGVLNCTFILLAFFVGQAAYLGSEYWLITWAYRWFAALRHRTLSPAIPSTTVLGRACCATNMTVGARTHYKSIAIADFLLGSYSVKGVSLPDMRHTHVTACRPAEQQKDPKWLIVYGILVICVVCISLARALAFFESTFRCNFSADPVSSPSCNIIGWACMAAWKHEGQG